MIKFCPNCGSVNVKWVFPQLWSMWECKDCFWRGPFIIEDGKMAEEVRKDYLKKHKEDSK